MRNRSGSDRRAMVRHDCQYCLYRGPLVYGRSHRRHTSCTFTHSPLEREREHGVPDDVQAERRMPRLVAGHPDHAVSHVIVHPDDVRVLVMVIVVGGLPSSMFSMILPAARRPVPRTQAGRCPENRSTTRPLVTSPR